MFEALEKAIQQREKVLQTKDLYYQSEEHKQFYSICKDMPFYRWEYLLNNQEPQHTNIALAITLIKRLKELFLNNADSEHQLIFDPKETVVAINGCLIQAFPSHHLDAMRDLTNVAIVFQDEASFFEINQANDAIEVSQRYIAKSDPYLIVSTPNKPGDMLHMMSEQPEEKCFYCRMYLSYTVGKGNIFSKKDIEIAKKSASFESEYNLKFLELVGNVLLPEKIDAAITLGREHDIYKRLVNNPDVVP
jgi:hypothetical protein